MKPLGVLYLVSALGGVAALHAGTDLSKAALKGDVPKIQARLAAGEPVDEMDKWGWTPLMWAVYYRYMPAAQCLLDHRADPNTPTTKKYGHIPPGSTPLHICGYFGLEDFAAILVKAGADPHRRNGAGKTPLDYAREFRFDTVVEAMSPRPASHRVMPKPQPAPATVQPVPAPKAKASTKKPRKAPEPSAKSEPPAIK